MKVFGGKSDELLGFIRDGKPLTSRDKLNLIIQLSIPSILAQITSVVMFFIDQAMVGHLGAEASAACGLVETSTWLLGSLTGAASMGFSVQVAHFIGSNDFVKARQVFRHALIVTTILSLLLMIVAVVIAKPLPYWLGGGPDIAHDASIYFMIFALAGPFFQLNSLSGAMLKCSGNMRIPSMVSVAMCVLDVVFNYLLIYQAHLGVMGAAIGTSLSIVICSLVQAYIAIFRSPMLSLRRVGESFTWVGDYLRNAVKIGVPMAMQSVLMSGAQIVSTMIVAPLGTIAIAANTLGITAESLCYMPGYGIGEAATTLIGQSIGAARKDLCKSFARMTLYSGMIVMAVMGAVMFVLAYEMMGVMTPVEEIRTLGAQCLRIEAFAEPMFAASIIAVSVCVGAGDTLKPALISLGSMWFVRLTLAYALSIPYGLVGVWIAMAIELTFRGLLLSARLFRGRWMNTKVMTAAA
ncbi:MAG: MATE family efflux transporter [Prevotella sp.]|nr:MATE family efflux transporter [Prevotella sp.]